MQLILILQIFTELNNWKEKNNRHIYDMNKIILSQYTCKKEFIFKVIEYFVFIHERSNI